MPGPVRWTEVRVDAPAGWHELVAASLAFDPCTSISVEPGPGSGVESVRTYLPSNQDAPALRARICASVEALGVDVTELTGLEVTFTPLPTEDYAESWKQVWRPFRLGRRLVVAPPWWEGEVTDQELLLTLEPGGAFGSGKHPTTRACARALVDRLQGGERVLDAGSGNGILSVTAALAGAGPVLGFDIDPTASAYGEALAAANGMSARCSFRQGGFEVLTDADIAFDVITANIYSDVVQAQAGALAARLAPTGWFVFSGIPRHHHHATAAAIRAAGLVIEEERRRGRWHSYLGRRDG
ncbi:MAG: 50S ribosomal protein L11 methyltransferase [Planctomycetota bacterium]|nr:50S ribosomal protein L11 methyltransferase [Planctomycetota bacterium]